MTRPCLWLLAGPNGSGKSTFAQSSIFDRLSGAPETPQPLVRLNADAVAKELAIAHPELPLNQVSLLAAQHTDDRVDELIAGRASFLVETVLSSDKYFPRLEASSRAGYWIGLVFVLLTDPDLNVRRVAQRVAQGGHSVPEDKIRDRWKRSLERLPKAAAFADAGAVVDNSATRGLPELLISWDPTSYYVSWGAVRLKRSRSKKRKPLADAMRATIAVVEGGR